MPPPAEQFKAYPTPNREFLMDSGDLDFKFERFEEYFGDVKQVSRQINECPMCGAGLVFTHFADYTHFYVQETACCPECDSVGRKLIHILN